MLHATFLNNTQQKYKQQSLLEQCTVLDLSDLKEARDESSRLKDAIALKDKKLAHMNKALAHKVHCSQIKPWPNELICQYQPTGVNMRVA